MCSIDKRIIEELEKCKEGDEKYFDFEKREGAVLSHRYHTYPAKMVEELPRELIRVTKRAGVEVKKIYDPFCGSGTTIVEGVREGLEVYTNDINPLACMLGEVKTRAIDPYKLEKELEKIKKGKDEEIKVKERPEIKNIEYWFKEGTIEELLRIREKVKVIEEEEIRYFYEVVFSETVRKVSMTRQGGYKLHRIEKEKVEKYNPDVWLEFEQNARRNIEGNKELYEELKGKEVKKEILNKSTKEISKYIEKESIDLLITSPPYGDSKTTMGYGEFSRFGLEWLGKSIEGNRSVRELDKIMLGGKVSKKEIESNLESLKSKKLKEVYEKVKLEDEKRSKELLQFYIDIDESLREIEKVMKEGSYQYWVVGNRSVKGNLVPMDEILEELYEKYGVKKVYKFERNIKNKRMPKSNAPRSKKGEVAETMNKEIIVLFRKEGRRR